MTETPRISDSEWLVMKVLWGRPPATTVEVMEALAPNTAWKLKTVLTLLNRLVKKGAVGSDKQGRAYLYYPLVDEGACVRAQNRSFLNRVYDGSLAPMLARFFEESELSPDEIQELKDILEAKEKKS